MRQWILGVTLAACLGLGGSAFAGSHCWQVNEVFSSPDGSVQFIELKEACGAPGETGLNNKWVRSDATGNQYDFTANLIGPTSDKSLLLATQAFADLPGAPTPDYIIAENFFALDGDTLTYWMYGSATMVFGAGELPTDGVNSLERTGATGPNSPTNYAGDTGSVTVVVSTDPEFIRGDANLNGGIEIADAISMLEALFSGGVLACALTADFNDDNANDIADAVGTLSYLFTSGSMPSSPFPDCGTDPTPGSLSCDDYPCP